ncbi:MAG: hypothetical protein EOP10_22480 [Proteobacteria bacterium]|nr:MAG: hypothetical protein EOP10_22480 [Pseudomonadota bacterium]
MMDQIPGLLTSAFGQPVILSRMGLDFEVFGIMRKKLQNYGLSEEGKEIFIDGLSVSIAAEELPFEVSSRDKVQCEGVFYDIDYIHKTINGMYRLSLSESDLGSEDE